MVRTVSARVINVPQGDLPIPAIEEAAAVLDDGGLVIIPTDTVYGLSCRAGRPDALARVYAAKGRPDDKPLPYLLPDASAVPTFVNRVAPIAQRLMDRFWPGALTLVLGPDDGVALRVPDHPVARAVLKAAGGPVHATSANLSGAPDTTTGVDAAAALGDAVDLVLDAGNAPGGAASAIVRVPDVGPIRILRAGAISPAELYEVGRFTVAMVCTGNTCRSPMAAAMLRHLLARRLDVEIEALPDHGIDVVSAGVAAWPGSAMTPEAAQALRAAGVPVPDHASRTWTPELAASADLVLTMTPSHLAAVRDASPDLATRASLLDPDGGAVDDPIGGDLEVYRDCLAQMGAHLAHWLDLWYPRPSA